MKQLLTNILTPYPRLKASLKAVLVMMFPRRYPSSGYVKLAAEESIAEGMRLSTSWQDSFLPQRQRELVEVQLEQYRQGIHIDVFDILVTALCNLPGGVRDNSILEVGCSSGFYSEVFEIAGLEIKYSGCDYSHAFIRLAREKYPSIDFAVDDATAMHYADRSFDVVISGCCLLHIPEYKKGIEEVARVASRFAIFHRTPVVWGQPEQWYRKNAYGVETVEIHFNEPEFLILLAKSGLELIATHTLSEETADASRIEGRANRTYVCRKRD